VLTNQGLERSFLGQLRPACGATGEMIFCGAPLLRGQLVIGVGREIFAYVFSTIHASVTAVADLSIHVAEV
jgi:hypothetical protein